MVFVWGVWLAMLLEALDFVSHFGVDVPYFDEWEMIPALTGNQPISLQWLWSQHNEHRLPLPRKYLYLAVEKLARCDFRAGMFFNVLALSGMAATCIVVASRLRGKPNFTDAFFPLVLLHEGHWENLIASFQVEFILSRRAQLRVAVRHRVLQRRTIATKGRHYVRRRLDRIALVRRHWPQIGPRARTVVHLRRDFRVAHRRT